MEASPALIFGLVAVAFVAGLVDAMAGGGGLLTVPAILAAGVPPHVALATNKGQSVFGSGAAVIAFARRGTLDTRLARATFPMGFVGACAGTALVIAIPPRVLEPIVLVLLPLAAATLFLPRRERTGAPAARPMIAGGALALSIGAYDGFFGPGTGTFLVVGFAAFLRRSLLRASADAKVVNFASNLAALALFASRGLVLWKVSLPMALGQLAGGYTGAHLALRGGDKLIRVAVLVIVAALVVKLALDVIAS